MNIGDRIRDIEDSDCYFEGIIVGINPIVYRVTNALWNGEVDDSMNGQEMELRWWIVAIFRNGEWIELRLS